MCNWQRVEVELPDVGPSGASRELLVLEKYNQLSLGAYNALDGQWYSYGEVMTMVTHWATVELPGE